MAKKKYKPESDKIDKFGFPEFDKEATKIWKRKVWQKYLKDIGFNK